MNIRMYGFAVATAALLAVQTVQAQPVNGCPAGQAMQSSDPGGRNITCVPIPDTANIFNLLNAETAARQAADDALHRRIDALTEADIVGRWSVSGTTSCLLSTRNFNADFTPVVTPGIPTFVSQLTANTTGIRTFNADGTGSSTGATQALTHGATVHGVIGMGPAGGASIAGIDGTFTWHIQADGTLFLQDTNPIVQPFLAPSPARDGFTATILDLPPFVGPISKDRRTIVMAHPGMAVETSVFTNPAGVELNRTARFCLRSRVLTRLPD
jgi:hypothetical protein